MVGVDSVSKYSTSASEAMLSGCSTLGAGDTGRTGLRGGLTGAEDVVRDEGLAINSVRSGAGGVEGAAREGTNESW